MHCRYPDIPSTSKCHGFSLMEVMIGVFLSTLLMTGIAQLMSGSVAAYRSQLDQSQMEESIRYAREVLTSHISQAGFQTTPWLQAQGFSAVTSESVNGTSPKGDQLGLQRMSRYNCYGSENPVKDASGQAKFFLLQTRFSVNKSNNLAMTCRYGADTASLVTQVNSFGVVEGVESLQVLFAEDQDGDAVADHWVTAQAWQNESRLIALKVALLLKSDGPFKEVTNLPVTVLDETINPPADGRLRRVSHLTTAVRGRLR